MIDKCCNKIHRHVSHISTESMTWFGFFILTDGCSASLFSASESSSSFMSFLGILLFLPLCLIVFCQQIINIFEKTVLKILYVIPSRACVSGASLTLFLLTVSSGLLSGEYLRRLGARTFRDVRRTSCLRSTGVISCKVCSDNI